MISFEVRNGCDSSRLLIEFGIVPLSTFMPLWENILLIIKAELVSTEDVWQNDEYIRRYISPLGRFVLTVSNHEISFIMADDFGQENSNNFVILGVAEALIASGEFERKC